MSLASLWPAITALPDSLSGLPPFVLLPSRAASSAFFHRASGPRSQSRNCPGGEVGLLLLLPPLRAVVVFCSVLFCQCAVLICPKARYLIGTLFVSYSS